MPSASLMIRQERRPRFSNRTASRLSISTFVMPWQNLLLIRRAALKREGCTTASNAFSTRIHCSGAFLTFLPFSFVEDRLKTLLPTYFSLVRIFRTLVLVQGRPYPFEVPSALSSFAIITVVF